MNIWQDTNDPSFYYDNALSHCTTLEYDEHIIVLFSEYVDMPLRVQNIWKYEKAFKYMEINFLKAFELFKKMFWQCKRLNYNTFCALITVINISFEWKKYKH
jgi:hypothetical protein